MARTWEQLTPEEVIAVEELNDVPNNSMIHKDNNWNYQAITIGADWTVPTSNGPTLAPTFQAAWGWGVTALSVTKYVDWGTAATSRDWSIWSPYISITEALSNITDATTLKRYTLEIIKADNTASFTAKPFIFIVGDSLESVSVWTITIPNTVWDYWFENIKIVEVETADLTSALNINFRNTIIQTATLLFTISTTSATQFTFIDSEFQADLDVRQMAASFSGCSFKDHSLIDFTSISLEYIYDNCTFDGAYTTSGSTTGNNIRMTASHWTSNATFSTLWAYSVTTDDSSFPFPTATNVTISQRDSIAILNEYDPAGTGLVATNVQAAITELDAWGGGWVSEIFSVFWSANYSLTTTITVIPFNTEDFDTGSNFDITTFKFTAPSAWKYVFTAMIFATSFTAWDRVQAQLFKNWANVWNWQDSAVAADHMINLTGIFDLAINDTMEVRWRNITAARWLFVLWTTSWHFSGYKLA